MNTEQLKIWFAGFYEGEGSISNDIGNNYRLRVNISQNDRAPLDIGRKLWNGYVRKRVRKSPSSDKICTGHEWRLSHNDSVKFIKDIKKYMLIPYKIQQIEKAFEIYEKRNENKLSFKCNFCDNVYANPSGRRRHEKKEHIHKGQKFICEICKNSYCSKDSLNRHKKIHTNQNSVASENL